MFKRRKKVKICVENFVRVLFVLEKNSFFAQFQRKDDDDDDPAKYFQRWFNFTFLMIFFYIKFLYKSI